MVTQLPLQRHIVLLSRQLSMLKMAEALEQHKRLTGLEAKQIFADRGYKGHKQIGNTTINIPKTNPKITLTQRIKHKRRAAIEPVIGHLKHDYRMIRNFLKGNFGDAINVMLAAAAMNFKRMMNLWKAGCDFFVLFISALLIHLLEITMNKYQSQKIKYTF